MSATTPVTASTIAPATTAPVIDPPKAKDPRKNADGTLKLGIKMATIFVGNQTEPFVVHHNLITASSGFFAKALNGEFKEKEGIVRLKDQNAEHFSRYIQWLYDGKVLFDRAKENRHKVLMQTILGSFIQDRWYCNALIDALIDDVVKKYSFPSALSREAFAKLPASSPFLKLLVDFWVYVRIPSIT